MSSVESRTERFASNRANGEGTTSGAALVSVDWVIVVSR
jgi:hypothetical protein